MASFPIISQLRSILLLLVLLAQSYCSSAFHQPKLTHADITWKLRPPPETTPVLQRIQYTISGPLLRLRYLLSGNDPPRILFPNNTPSILLEAWYESKKIGRFGCTVEPGPTPPVLIEAVRTYFAQDMVTVPAGAIIYMFVEPSYRGRGVGELALETIGVLQAAKGCYYTLLVADTDDARGRLVQWYERHGFVCAPLLQDMLGSPNQQYGVAMMGPTPSDLPNDDDWRVEWW